MPLADSAIQDLSDDSGSDDPDSSDSADPIQIDVVCRTDISDAQADISDAPFDAWLAKQARHAVRLCKVNQAQLTLAIVADEEMADLHEQYTGVAGTTDVLTFDLSDHVEADAHGNATESLTVIEGDIILCIDEARRQAAQRSHDTGHELLLYVVHGLMHLLGEDDHTEEDFHRMHAREDALLNQMGVGPLFDPDRRPDV